MTTTLAQARFTGLVRTHGTAVVAYVTRRTEPPSDAADLFAEVFLVAWRRLAAVPLPEPEARAWLLGVARHQLANHRRAVTRRHRLADRLRAHLESEETARPDVELPEVRAALDALRPPDREILTLLAWDDLSVGQAASVLGVSASTARKRLERARRRFRAELGRRGAEPSRRLEAAARPAPAGTGAGPRAS